MKWLDFVLFAVSVATVSIFIDVFAPVNKPIAAKSFDCIDTRDGQQFSFNTGAAFEIRSEKDWRFKVKTTDGEIRTFTQELLTVIKCRSENETI